MFSSTRIFSFLFVLPFSLNGLAQCNGHFELCDKPFNHVAFLTTHNAYNAEEDGFTFPNHNFGITRQLQDGVRGLMIDVYDEGGVATVYHSVAILGTATLESNLTEIKDFLDANPNEIVTIIFECYADFELIETAFINTNLLTYVLEQDLGEEWPTLQEMIDDGNRLVVLSDRNDAALGEDWYHYVWDYAVETPFSNNSNSDFTCEFNRGDEGNDLFILNHFATDPNVGVGRPDLSELANEFDFFYNRSLECMDDLGKFPNFPTIDFHEFGEPFRVVDSLNLNNFGLSVKEENNPQDFLVVPNPGTGEYTLSWNTPLNLEVKIYDSSMKLVGSQIASGKAATLDISEQPVGVYHAVVQNEQVNHVLKLVKL